MSTAAAIRQEEHTHSHWPGEVMTTVADFLLVETYAVDPNNSSTSSTSGGGGALGLVVALEASATALWYNSAGAKV